MNPEDYVSYPLALALKKHGFDEPCDHYWYKVYTNSDEMNMRQASADDFNNDDWDVPHCSAPTLSQAQKWLREKKKIDIELRIWMVGDTREYRPYIMPPKKHDFIAYPPEKSYELALSAGIAAALELIEKKGE